MSEKELTDDFMQFLAFLGNDAKKVLEAYELMVWATKDARPRSDGSRIAHVLRVTLKAIELGAMTRDEIITSLLHDVPEDQPYKITEKLLGHRLRADWDVLKVHTFTYIEREFGSQVKEMLQNSINPSSVKELTARHAAYVEHVKKLLTSYPKEARLKLADMYDNGFKNHTIEDDNFRKSMCQRYLPVYPAYLEAIEKGFIQLAPGTKHQVIEDLERAYVFTKNELGITV